MKAALYAGVSTEEQRKEVRRPDVATADRAAVGRVSLSDMTLDVTYVRHVPVGGNLALAAVKLIPRKASKANSSREGNYQIAASPAETVRRLERWGAPSWTRMRDVNNCQSSNGGTRDIEGFAGARRFLSNPGAVQSQSSWGSSRPHAM
jgi:hypothetical protein